MEGCVGLNHTISNFDEAMYAPSLALTHARSLKAIYVSIIRDPSTMGFDIEFGDLSTFFSTLAEYTIYKWQSIF